MMVAVWIVVGVLACVLVAVSAMWGVPSARQWARDRRRRMARLELSESLVNRRLR